MVETSDDRSAVLGNSFNIAGHSFNIAKVSTSITSRGCIWDRVENFFFFLFDKMSIRRNFEREAKILREAKISRETSSRDATPVLSKIRIRSNHVKINRLRSLILQLERELLTNTYFHISENRIE